MPAAIVMVRFPLLLTLAALAAPVDAQHRLPDQDVAREQALAGARPFRDVEQQWRDAMPGYSYLGSDYDPGQGSYRFKFMRGGAVNWVDVDGRTGREIGRSWGR